ncbi:alpha/beta fold hydrolase [Streptomyces cavernicola]|uniref:Alpha/beta hydrolase n=1 Tax=Streptomyces cavernicola TaxID=3043613 RepID=A0ABT6S2M4_9ACTN|nr:alpha/beta hydrolase [Streptomyces sp. B-S-A6]MDI3402347.1 alpha/beta hydrolase [Streptomyces sp. B-S-A6]
MSEGVPDGAAAARPVVARHGVRLRCRDWGGTGHDAVLLHGLAGHTGEWDALARELSPHLRLIAYDQRGHGTSDRHPADVSRAAHVADVVAVAEQLGLDRPVLIGHSLGGHTAMLTAAAHPELVRALVLVESGPGGNPQAPAEIGAWLDSWPVPFASRAAAVDFFGGGPVGEAWAAGLEVRGGGLWPRFERVVLVGSLAESARAYGEEWRGVGCPTLAVLARTGLLPARAVDAMLRARPATRAVSVPGTGHDLHLERPKVLGQLIRGFLDELN